MALKKIKLLTKITVEGNGTAAEIVEVLELTDNPVQKKVILENSGLSNLSESDLAKISNSIDDPSLKSVVVLVGMGNAGKWVDEAGNIKWPTNDGFAGKPQTMTLQTGTRIDRYGLENGKFVSPEGTPYGQRSLAPGTESKPYNVYEVVKPIDAQGGKIAPWFDENGGGIQYKFDKSIKELIDGGYLRRVER